VIVDRFDASDFPHLTLRRTCRPRSTFSRTAGSRGSSAEGTTMRTIVESTRAIVAPARTQVAPTGEPVLALRGSDRHLRVQELEDSLRDVRSDVRGSQACLGFARELVMLTSDRRRHPTSTQSSPLGSRRPHFVNDQDSDPHPGQRGRGHEDGGVEHLTPYGDSSHTPSRAAVLDLRSSVPGSARCQPR
jgi:hypothetical protein